ncbi:hypothetical protein WOLCODRAFT_145905 [Wolfiporia cocos MD-104 SS10]|uniref:Aminoglycoside phosphotransferase domain-containing protein n=1 Tax=Wolfiporia cocos (strain MD-104) TaxID=742152 RepID=A0A2H3JDA5_WOLCO|nr:hypothetical protein WOLCODRAFT_145905 [Wolfiporia cocos MD-104 SS10]
MTASAPSQGGDPSTIKTLPSWADISSLSDEDLFSLYGSCEHRFPQPSYIRFTSVRRIASDVVMKIGHVQDSEPLTMNLVRESMTILVPVVRRYLTVNGNNAIVMDYTPGQTLEDCWGQLGFWRRLRVVWTIRRYIRQLRCVLVPGTPRGKQFPGRIGKEPQLCYGPMFSDYGGGPFASYDELTSWYMHKLDVNRRIRKTPVEDVTFDSSLPLVLTHLDLNLRNLIIDHDSRVWLIDWEHAGFYPQWFEYAAMLNGWEMLGRWKGWILGFMAGFYKRQTSFIAEISWAILTGHFM